MLISIHKNFLRFNLLMGRVNVIHPNILECSFVLQKIQVLHSCSALLCSIKAFVLGNETLHMLHLRLVSTWKMKLKSFHPIQLELILRIMTMTLLRTMMIFCHTQYHYQLRCFDYLRHLHPLMFTHDMSYP